MNFDIVQVAELLGMIDKRINVTSNSFNVDCPFCGRKKKLNINTAKDAWRCNACGEHGGMLELYVKAGFGVQSYTKELGHQAAIEIEKKLGREIITQYREPKEIINDTTSLSDTQLNNVYSRLLKIPALHLSEKHKKNLTKKRGFSEAEIEKNAYRSLPEELWFPQGKEWSLKHFAQEGLDKIYAENPNMKKISKQHFIAGLYIGVYMNNHLHIDLTDVPGFFKVKNLWCFRYTPGILIPVRNIKGEIVAFQIRKDKGDLRYMTVSSKGFPEGKSGGTRIHFPINNPEITAKTVVRLTEGPLKADAALNMTKDKNVAYIAIMGVNAIKELPSVLQSLKDKGCSKIKNALDIDKITNPNVIKAEKTICKMVNESGLSYSQMFWDSSTAHTVLKAQEQFMTDHKINIDYPVENVFLRIMFNTITMDKKGLNKRGCNVEYKWPNANTKGIDDYLQSVRCG